MKFYSQEKIVKIYVVFIFEIYIILQVYIYQDISSKFIVDN